MLEQVRSSAGHWSGVKNIINTWLVERQELIRLYCALTEQPSDKTKFTPAL